MNAEQYCELIRVKMAGLVESSDVEWLPDADEINLAMGLSSRLQKVCEDFELKFSPRSEVTMPLAVAMLASINLNFYKPQDSSKKDCWWTVLNDIANTGELWPDLRVMCDYYENHKDKMTFQDYMKKVAARERRTESVESALELIETKIDLSADITTFAPTGIPDFKFTIKHFVERAIHWKEHYNDTQSAHDIEDFYETQSVDFDGLKAFLLEKNIIQSDSQLEGEAFFDSKDYSLTKAALVAYTVKP